LAILLPVALAANLRSLFKVEEARMAFEQPWVLAAPERSCDCHQMGIAKSLVGDELFHPSYGRDSENDAQGARPSQLPWVALAWNVNAGQISAQVRRHYNDRYGHEFHW
jgi:hypothetical protein